jgi:hypothetical protein
MRFILLLLLAKYVNFEDQNKGNYSNLGSHLCAAHDKFSTNEKIKNNRYESGG